MTQTSGYLARESVLSDLSLPQLAARELRRKWREMIAYEAAARRGTIAGIHDMRVAAKRLREAWRLFGPVCAPEASQELLPEIEALNDALGAVRDCDVLRQALKQLARKDENFAALTPLRQQISQERKRHQRRLRRKLERLSREGLARRYKKRLRALEKAEAVNEAPALLPFAATAIARRWEDFLTHLSELTGPYRSVAFHRQRIRVKRLKYALEPFLPLWPDALQSLYESISQLQELMGAVHDRQVQLERLAEWTEAHGENEGLRLATRQIRQQRQALLQQTKALAQELPGSKAIRRLEDFLAEALPR